MTHFFKQSLALTFLIVSPLAAAQAGQEEARPSIVAAPPIPALEITEVPKETRLIEEKSLRPNAAVGAHLILTPAQGGLYKAPNEGLAPISTGLKQLDPPSDRDTSLPSATRVFAFWLEPGESIRIRRTTEEESGVSMRLVQPTHQHPLSPQITKLNRMPQPLRSKRIEFKNTTTDRFKVVLLLYGRTGIPYKLEITRNS